jgi:uncharacterized membrane protein YphA (DoxX/SURF4 family)
MRMTSDAKRSLVEVRPGADVDGRGFLHSDRSLANGVAAREPTAIPEKAAMRVLRVFVGVWERLEVRGAEWAARLGIALLRINLGIVFLWFGALKFFPGLSPAQDLAARTIEVLTMGIMKPDVSLPVLATWECLIGLGLVTGRCLSGALLLLFAQMAGTILPLFFFRGRRSRCRRTRRRWRAVHHQEHRAHERGPRRCRDGAGRGARRPPAGGGRDSRAAGQGVCPSGPTRCWSPSRARRAGCARPATLGGRTTLPST